MSLPPIFRRIASLVPPPWEVPACASCGADITLTYHASKYSITLRIGCEPCDSYDYYLASTVGHSFGQLSPWAPNTPEDAPAEPPAGPS